MKMPRWRWRYIPGGTRADFNRVPPLAYLQLTVIVSNSHVWQAQVRETGRQARKKAKSYPTWQRVALELELVRLFMASRPPPPPQRVLPRLSASSSWPPKNGQRSATRTSQPASKRTKERIRQIQIVLATGRHNFPLAARDTIAHPKASICVVFPLNYGWKSKSNHYLNPTKGGVPWKVEEIGETKSGSREKQCK